MPRPKVQRRRSNNNSSSSSSSSNKHHHHHHHHRRKSPSHRSPRRGPPPAPADAGLTSAPRVKLQQQLAGKQIGQRPQDSDDSDRLVTRTQTRSRRKDEVFASGGVAKGDKPGVFPSSKERTRRLRSEMEEILLRRSRSKSGDDGSDRMCENDDSRPLVPDSQPTTTKGDTSVLGSLKPRRRQPSILHMIDLDSSTINPEDEEQFLPDDESTPLVSRGVGVGLRGTGSVSRKRKFGIDEVMGSESARTPPASRLATTTTTPSPEDSMSNPRSPKRLVYNNVDNDVDEIMAPPQSSSSSSSSAESSPQKVSRVAATRTRSKKVSVPTTEQLQSLMPSGTKRRKVGTRRQKDEFDIPEDSMSGRDESAAFVPGRQTATKKRTNRVKKSGAAAAAAATTSGPPTKPKVSSSAKNAKSTSSVSHRTVLSPVLTRKSNQENLLVSGGSPLKPISRTNTPIRKGRKTGAESDKENLYSFPFPYGELKGEDKGNAEADGRRVTRRSTRVAKSARPDGHRNENNNGQVQVQVQQSIEHVDHHPVENINNDNNDDDMEIEAEEERVEHVTETPAPPLYVNNTGVGVGVDDAAAWKRKWGDIDDWGLEYEDVVTTSKKGGTMESSSGSGSGSGSGESLIQVSVP